MNKKYRVEPEGKVTIITEEGEILERDKYTKNTDEILSLENTVESLERKVKIFKDRLNEHEENKKFNKFTMIATPIIIIILLGLLALISGSLEIVKIMGLLLILPISLLVEGIGLISYFKNKKKATICNQRITEESHKINKVKKRIDTLSQEKTPAKAETTSFIDVKRITDFNFDASDHFIEKYQIDKRTKEMSHHKARKRVLTKSNNMYTI